MSIVENLSPQAQTDQLLLKKKGMLSNDRNPNSLRNVIKIKQEQQFKQSKPFFKKYGSQNTTSKVTKHPLPQSRQSYSNQPKSQIQIGIAAGKGEIQPKNNTKQSFNQKLNNNIIKDEANSTPSKPSYRIKKVETKNSSPKKTRDDLIALNYEESKLQSQIFQIHKDTKAQLQKMKQKYKFQNRRLSDVLPQAKNDQGIAINWDQSQFLQKAMEKLSSKLRHKAKQLEKHQNKIDTNAYILFIKNRPEDIEQMNQSQEQDLVQELAQQKPRLEGNYGSYSVTMASIKQKNYALNLRRTYDVFKDEQKPEGQQQLNAFKQEKGKQEVIKEQGENRMTLNQKFKDFLLN